MACVMPTLTSSPCQSNRGAQGSCSAGSNFRTRKMIPSDPRVGERGRLTYRGGAPAEEGPRQRSSPGREGALAEEGPWQRTGPGRE